MAADDDDRGEHGLDGCRWRAETCTEFVGLDSQGAPDPHAQSRRRGHRDGERGEADGDRREKEAFELGPEEGEDQKGERKLHHLPGGAFEGDRPGSAAEVLGASAMGDRSVHIPDHATGKQRVEELGLVVHAHGGRPGKADAEAPSDELPAPGRRRRRDRGEYQCCPDRWGVEALQPVQEGARAYAGDDSEEDAPADDEAGREANPPRAQDLAGAGGCESGHHRGHASKST